VGSGTGTGTGSGSGGGTGGGGNSPDGLIPPSPTALFLPPAAPSRLHGRMVEILLSVDERGRVTDARLKVSTSDSKYDAALKKKAMEWRFRPARNAQGAAVKGTFVFTYTI
jgi:TonB family protein